MDEILRLKRTYKTSAPACSFNILRFPSFQSIVTLPKHIREERANHIEKWIFDNYDGGANFFQDWERDGMLRMVAYIREIETGHNHTSSLNSRERDFKSFYTQYDIRRNKNFVETFPMLRDWFESIPMTNIEALTKVVDGDDANSNRYVDEVMETAKKEGWVMKPQGANPGAQEYVEPDIQDEMLNYIKK
jgi:hypothetical protein